MITEQMLDRLRIDIRPYLSEQRYAHTLGVEKEIRYIASRLAPERLLEAAAAALMHDLTKHLTLDEQISFAEQIGLMLTEDERAAPALIHARTGAYFAKKQFPLFATDAVCEAIEKHTILSMPFGLLSAMLYLADYTEEGRPYSECKMLRALLHGEKQAGDDDMAHFRRALLAALRVSCEELLQREKHIALPTIATRNALIAGKVIF